MLQQVIVGADGKLAFVVAPYEQLCRMKGGSTRGTVPNEVVNLSFESGISPATLGTATIL